MSPTFAHSSESVYLFPISHSKSVVNVPDLVTKMVVVDTVIDSFVTVLDSLVEE